jgi:hypothetical protein
LPLKKNVAVPATKRAYYADVSFRIKDRRLAMCITRRQFILGTATDLILPSFYEKIITLWEDEGEVLFKVPTHSIIDVIAVDREAAGWN